MTIRALRGWTARRWLTTVGVAVMTVVLIAVPTALVDTPLFGREIAAPWWAWPSLVGSSLLTGMLVATYVAAPAAMAEKPAGTRSGWAGGVLTFFAVGCPVCNKLVLVALGSAGAVTWFEPVQPVLQLIAVALLSWALRQRLRGELACSRTDLEGVRV